MSANGSSEGVSVEGVCLSSCSRDVIADDVHALTFSIGILILLLLNITFILAGEMLCTFVISFFFTVLFTKQGIYIHSTIHKKIADGKNQVNLLSIYIIVINIPPMITDDIYIKSSNTSAKECADKTSIYLRGETTTFT